MSTGVAARVAAVCTALIGHAVAHAEERRPVAVVSLSDDAAATRLRKALYDQLQVHWALRSLGDSTLDAALEGSLGEDDKKDRDSHVKAAKEDLARAEDFLSQFDYARAIKDALGAQEELRWVEPSVMIPIYSDVTLVLGQAYLGDGKRELAQQAFGLVHRIDPMRHLDPGRYLPEIVDAFNVSTPTATTRKLQIVGKGHAWIDGMDRGIAPGTFDVGMGEHVVQLTGVDRITRGEDVKPDSATVEIPDQAASRVLQLQRRRIELASAPDSAARAGAMLELARVLGLHDAVLIVKRGDDLEVQTWRDQAPGFSELHVVRDQKPIDILIPLAPAKPPEDPKIVIPFPKPIHVDETPWYQKRWVQASAATVVVVGIVGAILYGTRDQFVNYGTDIKQGGTLSR